MKRLMLSLIVLGMVLPSLSFADKFHLEKTGLKRKPAARIHPIEQFLSGTVRQDRSSRDGDRLLVLLVDFLEDNDPQTTGNGEFVQNPGDYPFTFGKPPHDLLFFNAQLEALKHYYHAVSYGSLDVEFDIFPQAPITQFEAYTLPQEMSYYNPPGANQELMISRFEEYFQDIFTLADLDDDIDFSLYDHFMFIHAGSDWQHDVNGDSPADIPSFFIQMGTGKEVIVDDGIVMDHACNVPETITQDISYETDGGITYVDNYGFINAVMVHEFGHSIGFVDLYNTMNYSPQVGYYDIMDSGGMPLISLQMDDFIYSLEGVFPALPGPWSRLQAFETDFRNRGILKDITEFDLTRPIHVLPSSKVFEAGALNDSTAYIIKIPLNNTEYILIENRQVDPDGDGGTSIWTSNDDRVILHPTYLAPNPNNDNNYEYDYLLPGFQKPDALEESYLNYGGGLLIWHIDEAILAENNNYQNNTVNIRHSHRAVKIIEADNIDDIGNPYSLFWQGTEYEPFYKFMPIIDEYGFFQGWDDDYLVNSNGELEFIGTIFSDELSSTSAPALTTNNGDPAIFSIFDISSYAIDLFQERTMSFRFGVKAFDVTEKIAAFDSLQAIGQIGYSLGFPTFPALAENQLSFFSLMDENWADNFGSSFAYDGQSDFTIIPLDTDLDENDEFYVVEAENLSAFTPASSVTTEFDSALSDAPLFIADWLYSTLAIPKNNGIEIHDDSPMNDLILPFGKAKLSCNGSDLVAATDGVLHFFPDIHLAGAPSWHLEIPHYKNIYYPVHYVDETDASRNATFVQNEEGDIYKIQDYQIERIFRLSPYTSSSPSQLAMGDFLADGNIYLAFGAGDRVFAITLSGTLAPGFPGFLENRAIKPFTHPRIIAFPDETVIVLEEENNGFVAVNTVAQQSLKYSFYWARNDVSDLYFWDENYENLYYLYADKNHNLFSSYTRDVVQNPIIWNGLRNAGHSIYHGSLSPVAGNEDGFTAFAFPNPACTGEVRFKVLNAESEISLKIFDIAGNLLENRLVEWEETQMQDIRWNTSKIATGVYFAIIKSNANVKKIPFAIVN